ncbi:MAG: hypothetical protein HQK96_09745 [Nitrospirae bacterium]|nr:hypothetical protein [Nitrospirota bacterium]MBF0554819.1 hypothetical protein [Nitrospirota bacterium]
MIDKKISFPHIEMLDRIIHKLKTCKFLDDIVERADVDEDGESISVSNTSYKKMIENHNKLVSVNNNSSIHYIEISNAQMDLINRLIKRLVQDKISDGDIIKFIKTAKNSEIRRSSVDEIARSLRSSDSPMLSTDKFVKVIEGINSLCASELSADDIVRLMKLPNSNRFKHLFYNMHEPLAYGQPFDNDAYLDSSLILLTVSVSFSIEYLTEQFAKLLKREKKSMIVGERSKYLRQMVPQSLHIETLETDLELYRYMKKNKLSGNARLVRALLDKNSEIYNAQYDKDQTSRQKAYDYARKAIKRIMTSLNDVERGVFPSQKLYPAEPIILPPPMKTLPEDEELSQSSSSLKVKVLR